MPKLLSLSGLTGCVLALGLSTICRAEAQTADLVETVDVRSEVLDETRQIWVHTPELEAESDRAQLPVLYVLNRRENFNLAVQVSTFLSDKGMIPPLLVVGVPHAGGRMGNAEYKPFEGETFNPRADQFLSFLTEELIPYVDESYPTAPTRLLAGHSLAGMFTAYALLQSPDSFNGYIALSPSFHHATPLISEFVDQAPELGQGHARVLYMSLGEVEYHRIRHAYEAVLEGVDGRLPETLRHELTYASHLDHRAVPLVGLHDGIMEIFSHYRLSMPALRQDGFEGTVAAFDRLSAELGMDVRPSEQALGSIDRYLAQPDRVDHPAIAEHAERMRDDIQRLQAYYYSQP